MIIEHENSTKLAFFQDLYEEARAASDDLLQKMEKNLKQYKGSGEIDGSNVEAKQVRNLTYELVESQVTGYIPNPSVTPKIQSDKNERNAKNVETLLKNKRDELPFEKMNDMDERFNPIYGGSVWLTEWDNSIITHNTVGDVKISCLSPRHFVGQPNIYDIDDMEYCFITFETTKEDVERRYNVSLSVAEQAESDENEDDKTATIYVCYYKNEDDKVCQYIWSGDVELLDLEDYFARKRRICKTCGKREELCTCEKPKFEYQNEEYEELDRDIQLSDGSVIPAMSEVIRDGQVVMKTEKRQALEADGSPAFRDAGGIMVPITIDVQVPKLEKTKLPFYSMTRLPIRIRKNTSEEDNLFGQSDCEFIRPQQQAVNKLETRILEKLMSAGVYPIVPKDFNDELDNSIFKKVFRASPETFNQFGRIDLQVDISRDTAQSERLYDQAKRILGITDSFQGQYDSSAQSGKAKQLQIQQAAGRLDSKRQMKNAVYAEIDEIIFQYYLAYADEPRAVTYRDANGALKSLTFSRYDFIERDEAGEYYYNDQYLFRTDASVDVDRAREFLWQENRQNLQSGAYGLAQLPQTLLIYWQNMERAHYPFAADNVERLKAEIARQNEIAQLKGQVDQLGGKVKSLEGEVQNRAGYENYLMEQIKKMGGQING